MRVHHLDCVSKCAGDGRLIGGCGCHCLLVETYEGLVLVDTGLGLRDVGDPRGRPRRRVERTAIHQLERLGLDPHDVRHIVITHLDHAGGLDDFPQATVHLMAGERTEAAAQGSSRQRWRTYGLDGERWYGFDRVSALEGVTDDVVLIPLRGHSLGHAGVAVRGEDGWLLLAGDAYFHHGELDMAYPRCPWSLRVYQWMTEKDRAARLANQVRLRSLRLTHGHEITIFCSHDREELARLAESHERVSAPVAAVARAEIGVEPWVGMGLELS